MLDWLLGKLSWKYLFYNSNSIQEDVDSQALKEDSWEMNSFSGSRKTFLPRRTQMERLASNRTKGIVIWMPRLFSDTPQNWTI